MGFETDAYKSIEEKLKEEIKQRNLHLVETKEAIFNEETFRPNPRWLLSLVFLNFLGGLLVSLFLFVALSELFYRLFEFKNFRQYLEMLLPHLNIILGAVSFAIGLKLFFKRFYDSFASYINLKFTEYQLADYFLYVKTHVAGKKGRFLPLTSINSVYLRQNLIQKIFNVGDIIVSSPSGRIYLHSLNKFQEVADKILERIKRAQEVR